MSIGNPKAATEFTAQNKVQLIQGGKPYFDLLFQLIKNAKESIHLQTYIYDDDLTGKQVAQALKDAVERNVQVYMIADAYASKVMSQKFIDDLRSYGVNIKLFEPLFKSKYFYFGRRMNLSSQNHQTSSTSTHPLKLIILPWLLRHWSMSLASLWLKLP